MSEIKEIRKRFLHSLKLGTGEAYLIQRENSELDFSKEILKGAFKNFAYDPQAEGSRAKYIYGLLKKSRRKDELTKIILKKIPELKEDDWDLYQLLEIAVLIYKDGNRDGLNAIIKRFDNNLQEGFQYSGQEQLIEANGVDGVIRIAEVRGEILLRDEEDYEDSWLIDQFQRKNPDIDIYEVLRKRSEINILIKAYYDSILRNPIKPFRKRKPTKISYKLIKEKILSGKFWYISKERAAELDDQDVNKLANEFLLSKEIREKENYLKLFRARKFPYDYSELLTLAKLKNLHKTRAAELAIEALAFFKNDEIRELALEKIAGLKNPADYFPLLISNYQDGDDELLLKVIDRSDNFDFIHSLIPGILDIFQANATTACKRPLEAMYRKMNCGIHRLDIVELLYKNCVLSEEIIQELRYDSNTSIRNLFRRIKRTKKH